VTGVVLTKLDGDARGGAALSGGLGRRRADRVCRQRRAAHGSRAVSPDRIVSRMLGMGDVLSLIEKAEQAIDQDEAADLEEKLRKNEFTLDDFRKQLKTIRRMGPLESILGMIPGARQLKQLADNKPDEKQMGRVEAIISSMTAEERRNDRIINGSRRKRIAKGSGTTVEEVNRLLKQFGEMRKVLAMMSQGGVKGMPKMPKMPQAAQAGSFAAARWQEAEEGRPVGVD
jgi:signal recognition particle subunit SRP54